MNMDNTKLLTGMFSVVQETHEAVLNFATKPLPKYKERTAKALTLGQYRANIDKYASDPYSYLFYPVFDTFERENLAGILAVTVSWQRDMSNILSSSVTGVICIIENSFNQSLAYRIDGHNVTFLGEGDPHESKYNHLEIFADINTYLETRAAIHTRSYLTVPLNKEHGKYTIRVYPSTDTEEPYQTNAPWVYTAIVLATFTFTCIVFIAFAYVVERRQKIVMDTALKNARQAAESANKAAEMSRMAAETEQQLNEFLAHEIRNPLAAAMSACVFIRSTVEDISESREGLPRAKKMIMEDMTIIDSSLHFINDFLRNILDIHRADAGRLEPELAPVDLLKDVFEPVSNMLYNRDLNFKIVLDCPDNLVVNTDCLRLKQIMLNLGRNATKFVRSGFIRFWAGINEGLVQLYVEDSGPGIPLDKRAVLFTKYQTCLDSLSQGTGIGLCLCKKLVATLGGDIFLDETYDSGVVGSPGARFVVKMNARPLEQSSLRAEAVTVGGGSIEPGAASQEHTSNNEDFGAGPSASARQHSVIGVVNNLEKDDDELPEGLSVLFVDDDRVLRKLFSRAVVKVAPTWKIKEAASGETALNLVDSESFDLIFMDQYMASTEKQLLGTETVRALRAKQVKSRICGLSANDVETPFLNAGADVFVSKPIPAKPAKLKRLLARIIDEPDERKNVVRDDVVCATTVEEEVQGEDSEKGGLSCASKC